MNLLKGLDTGEWRAGEKFKGRTATAGEDAGALRGLHGLVQPSLEWLDTYGDEAVSRNDYELADDDNAYRLLFATLEWAREEIGRAHV